MSRSLSFRRSIVAFAAPALLLALASCSGEDSADEPTATSSETSTEEATPTEDTAEGEEVDKAAFLADMKAAVESASTAHMSMETDIGGLVMTADGQVDYTGDQPAMAMTMVSPMMGAEEIDVRLIDNIMYMNMGQMSNGKFLRFDLDDPNSPLGDVEALTGSMDPLQAFGSFAKGLESVTFVGDEDVDGEQLAHYTLTLDTDKVEALSAYPDKTGLPPTLEYDVWLDEENRMRVMDMDLGESAKGKVHMEIFDWDEPVEVEAPPADQVFEGRMAG